MNAARWVRLQSYCRVITASAARYLAVEAQVDGMSEKGKNKKLPAAPEC